MSLTAQSGVATPRLEDLIRVIAGKGEPVEEWTASNRALIEDAIDKAGGVLLRGFAATAPDAAEKVLSTFGLELLDNAYWSTPRTGVSNKTFTATEYASARSISLHSEMSYMTSWPRLVAFHALIVAESGGETTILDIDAASAAIGDIVEAFARRGVLYQRTHHSGVDIPWRKAYQTESRSEAERIALDAGMEVRWLANDVLQTRHRAQGATATEDGRLVYFNQANLFHPANLPPAARGELVRLFGAETLPRNAQFGDGAPIPDDVIHAVNDAFNRKAHGVAWRAGDILILDNMRFAHGRSPFKGSRKLHVAMAGRHRRPARSRIEWRVK